MLRKKIVCRICGEDYPDGWPHVCDPSDIEDNNDDSDGYCMCGALHSDEEIDWNECDSCGGKIN